MSSIYEWTDRALALPGAPEIWHRASEGQGLVTVDGDEGLYGIASDGTWWEPTGRADRPWILALDHHATAGCLLALLPKRMAQWIYVDRGRYRFSVQNSAHAHIRRLVPLDGAGSLGRAAIAAAAALGRWPGGEG